MIADSHHYLWIVLGDSSYTPLSGGLPEVWGYKHKVKYGLLYTIGKPVVMPIK